MRRFWNLAIDWFHGFIIPLIEITFLLGIIGFILFYFGKAFHNAWSKSAKFILKYRIMRKPYPETTVKWVVECIEKGIGYYDAKKLLMIHMTPQKRVNETMWIFDQIINELNKQGGVKNGREFKGSNRKTETTTEFPSFK